MDWYLEVSQVLRTCKRETIWDIQKYGNELPILDIKETIKSESIHRVTNHMQTITPFFSILSTFTILDLPKNSFLIYNSFIDSISSIILLDKISRIIQNITG